MLSKTNLAALERGRGGPDGGTGGASRGGNAGGRGNLDGGRGGIVVGSCSSIDGPGEHGGKFSSACISG
jgi:hypothetical protein